jgi:hypothetical protein
MEDLEKVKNGNLTGIRKNDAARILGDQYISGGSDRYN